MANVKNIFINNPTGKLLHLLILRLGLALLLLTSTGNAASEVEEGSIIYFPTSGDICKRCGSPVGPNVYYARLEEMFSELENKNYTSTQIIKSVEDLLAKEITDIALYAVDSHDSAKEYRDWVEYVIKNKIEGFKVLSNVFEIHYGSWGKDIVEDTLSAELNICAFDESGKNLVILDYLATQSPNCKKMSIHEVFDLLKNEEVASKLTASLYSPSIIEDKFVGKKTCKGEDCETPKIREKYCGILKSKIIREVFLQGKVLVYVGNQHQSYACKQVALFFQKNKYTNKIDPQSERSYLVHPNGAKEDLEDEQVREIIKEIYRSKEVQ